MATISAAMVKDLRDKTGAGMMDCKVALGEVGGDIEQAVDWLRKKGLSKAAKKSGRIAAEGLVAIAVEGPNGVVVELNSETDFVARNEDFQMLAHTVARVAVETGEVDIEALRDAAYPDGTTVGDALSHAIATIGENMTLRRLAHLHVKDGVIGSYTHPTGGGLGRIGVIVALESTGDADALAQLGRQIAMHVAATSPLALDSASIDPEVVARERNVLAEKNAGKPPQVLEKIVASGLATFYREVCLLEQPSVHADHAGKPIGQVVRDAARTVGAPVVLTDFVRYALGEGIARPDEPDFASEVLAQAGLPRPQTPASP